MVKKNRLFIIFMLASILAFAGCAHLMPAPSMGTEEALREKIGQEWEAKMNGNAGALYDLTTDEHKKRVARDSFRYQTNVNLTGFSIKDMEILEEGTKALVHVNIEVRQMGFDFTFPSREVWLWQRGEWRLDIKPGPKGAGALFPTQQ